MYNYIDENIHGCLHTVTKMFICILATSLLNLIYKKSVISIISSENRISHAACHDSDTVILHYNNNSIYYNINE